MTKIQALIESSLRGIRRAKCLKNVGIFLVGASGVCYGIYSIVDKAMDQESLPVFFKSVTLSFILVLALLGIAAFVAGVALLLINKAKLSKEGRAGRSFERIDEAPKQLIARIRALGARGETADTFIQEATLEFLVDKNPDYVQAWGRLARGHGQQKGYADVCFFVVAPLGKAGLRDMTGRVIRNNKCLRKEHVVKDPGRCAGLYVIEAFGQGPPGSKSRAAVLRLLFDYLEREVGERLAGHNFRVFARPATADGIRLTGHYSFENLGTEDKDMHAWLPPETRPDLCTTALSLFRAQA
jgi:hypothetical protein